MLTKGIGWALLVVTAACSRSSQVDSYDRPTQSGASAESQPSFVPQVATHQAPSQTDLGLLSTQTLVDFLRDGAVHDAGTDATKRALIARGDDALDPVSALLKERDAATREAAADVLEGMGSERALGALIDYAVRLLDESGGHAYDQAEQRLVSLGSKAIRPLERHYGADRTFTGREVVLLALERMQDPATLPVFMRALDDPEPQLAGQAEYVVGRLHAKNACKLLVARLGPGPVARRMGAIEGLVALGDRGAVPHLAQVLMAPDERTGIRNALPGVPYNQSEWLHIRAMKAIAWFMDPDQPYSGEEMTVAQVHSWIAKHGLTGTTCPPYK